MDRPDRGIGGARRASVIGSRRSSRRSARVAAARGSSGWSIAGSDVAFAVAAALANAVVVIGLARVLTGKPLGRGRVVAAAVGYSVFFAGIFSLMGLIFRDFLVANL